MEDSDILTLGWGCEPIGGAASVLNSSSWPSQGEEFVVLEVDAPNERNSQEYATLEVAKERDRLYYNSCVETEKTLQLPTDWELMRLEENVARTPLVAPTPVLATSQLATPITPLLPATTIATMPLQECYVPANDPFHPVQQYSYAQVAPPLYHPVVSTTDYHHTYHPVPSVHPYAPSSYSPFDPSDPKHLSIRSEVGNKFMQRPAHHNIFKREIAPREMIPKERKRPGPKAKMKSEEDCKVNEEPEYDPEVIANAHLTMEDDHYKCSVCKMKFKQPGNARRHIITVHRNEKPHDCEKCGAKFGRKDKLKTHMMRNHGYSNDDIKNTFKVNTQGRQRSSIVVNRKRSRIVVHRDNRKSTESNSNSSDDPEGNPLNLKSSRKHLNTTAGKRRKP